MKLIKRENYDNKLAAVMRTPDIKVLSGVRRAGKSKLLADAAKRIRRTDPKANIIFIDLTLLKYERLKEYHALNDFVVSHTKKSMRNYLFIDEVQLCKGFELAINSLHGTGRYDIYITGSNAFLLSSDLSTLFTGRHVETTVYPFSFSEFRRYFPKEKDIDRAFDSYVTEGGLAGSYIYAGEQERRAYRQEVYRTIIRRDIVQRFNLQGSVVLERLAEFLMDNVGNITSANNLAEQLMEDKVITNHVTVGNYLSYLTQAFLFCEIRRYDVRGRKYLEQSGKYYLIDQSLRYAILGNRNLDYGRVYENIVYLELRRRGYDVYVGKLYQKEIDFVAMRGGEKHYIQVCDDITSAPTLAREMEPLLKIRDAYPKIILARTRHAEYDRSGIRIIDIARWLDADTSTTPVTTI